MTTVTLTPSSTSPWTAPAGVTNVEVQCWGAGGNGGNATSSFAGGAGGGGGEFAQKLTVAVTPGSNYTFTCPSGGSTSNTVFTGDTQAVTAHPGGSGSGTSQGSGGTGSSNTTHFNGGSGAAGASTSAGSGGGSSAGTGSAGANGTAGSSSTAGSGGTAPSGGGNGGNGGAISANGANGTAPGGGAGGGGISGKNGGTGGNAQIILTYTAGTTHSGTATLSGSGTLSATGAFAGQASLSGSGTLSASAAVQTGPVLSGSGTLVANAIGNLEETVTLSGSGTLGAQAIGTLYGTAPLSGSGTLSGHAIQGYSAPLSGVGTLGIIGTGGTVAASAGASTPQAFPGTSQVSVAPQGSSAWQYLGSLGQVTALTYSFACPGGCDKLTCTVMVPATYRTQLFNPGWQVRVTRGGHQVWSGKLDEPVPTASGWTLTAVGAGNRGQDFVAVYTSTWPASEPDQAVNAAISRGMPWVNAGIGTPAGMWLGQPVDSGAQTITALLNLVCTRGGLTWYVNSQPGGQPGSDLSVFPLPTTVNRLIVCTQPVARTLGGDINTIFVKYQISAATTGTSNQAATFGVTSVQNAASVAAHGELETYVDLTSAGTLTSAQAQAVAQYVLNIYQRASFAGPFTVRYGELLNPGGQAIDLGTDQAATVAQLILCDYSYGGEVVPSPISFVVGGYSYDDFAQVATITPYQTLNEDFASLLSMESTILAPIQAQS